MLSIIFPYRKSNQAREDNLNYTVQWYKNCFPEAEIIIADDDDPNDFNRGRALNIGVAQSSGDVLILADGDLIVPILTLRRCVDLASSYGMIVPFSAITYLNLPATRRVLAGDNPFHRYADSQLWTLKAMGGCNIMTRKNFYAAGGFDPNFRGWGFEDVAFCLAIRFWVGPIFWEQGSATHLIHPTSMRSASTQYDRSKALCKEYERMWESSTVKPSKLDPKYCIKYGYNHRTEVVPFDDSRYTDQYQKEVYLEAANLMAANGWKSVIDIGCGSGYKLVNYLKGYDTLGIEVEKTLKFLQKKYPDKKWILSEPDKWSTLDTNLVVCSDVIEHVDQPDLFLEAMLDIECNMFLISTPERDIVRGVDHIGPPQNTSHFREWNLEEFKNFLSLYFVVQDIKVVNVSHGTMLAWCTRK